MYACVTTEKKEDSAIVKSEPVKEEQVKREEPAPPKSDIKVKKLKIVVMEIEDRSEKLDKKLLENAAEVLRVELVASNMFIVVSKDRQKRVLKDLKKKSHEYCFSKECQIPLGQALSADTVISTSITLFGGEYTISSEQVDIAKEASVKGARVKFDGGEKSLAAAVEKIAAAISGKNIETASAAYKKPLKDQPVETSPETAVNSGNIMTLSAIADNPYTLKGGSSEYIHLFVSSIAGKDSLMKERVPLNISLVIDRSGSMEDAGKLDFVKKASKLVIDNLAQSDNLSIVAYDDVSKIVRASAPVNDKNELKKVVDSIYPGGSTNLSGGMQSGYNQVLSSFNPKSVNRVLLLSDGLANAGITDVSRLEQITKKRYKESGIAISSFGVGAGFNEDLMTNLAEYGMGNYYFIDKADTIPDIFNKELRGLLSVVAQSSRLEVSFPENHLDVDRVYGYKFSQKDGKVFVDFNDIFSEERKAVLIRFRIKKPIDKKFEFKSSLYFNDVTDNFKEKQLTDTDSVTVTDSKKLYEKSFDVEVLKKIARFKSIEMMEEAAREADKRNYEKAQKMMKKNRKFLREQIDLLGDDDKELSEMVDESDDYSEKLEKVEDLSEEDEELMQKEMKKDLYEMEKMK